MSLPDLPFVRRCIWLALPLWALTGLSGCDQLGIETPAKTAERLATEAKAVGSACRHAMRAIEDCYTLNPKADKAAMFGGWREMDEYMRENKLEGVVPVVPRPPPEAPSKPKKAAPKPSDAEEAASEEDAEAKDEAAADEPKPKKGKADH